jgi:hypothetical protein
MNSGAAFSQIRRVIDLERRCFFSARWRGDILAAVEASGKSVEEILEMLK